MSSIVFYMWWNPVFILLIIFSTAVDFFIGPRLERETREGHRRLWLLGSLTANLGILACFKYAGFFQENLLYAMRLLGSEPHWTSIEVTLPVGISFYTFQTMSYSIDIH